MRFIPERQDKGANGEFRGASGGEATSADVQAALTFLR